MVQTTRDMLFFKSKLWIEYIPDLATQWFRRQMKIINLSVRTFVLCYFSQFAFSQFAKNFLLPTFLVNLIFSLKYMFTCCYPASKYWFSECPEEVSSNIPTTSPKHSIWPSGYHLTFWGRSESTSWRCILVGILRHF